MLHELHNRVAQSLTDALETMAFVTAEPAPPGAPAPDAALRITLAFSGPLSGVVELIAPDALGTLMVDNIATSPAESTPQAAEDALKELLNVTCGSMFRS